MSISDWLFCEHEFFRENLQHLATVVASKKPTSFDDLVVESRRPCRTVLLLLHQLVATGKLSSEVLSELSQVFDDESRKCDSTIQEKYLAAVQEREVPALLWGQRRLTPASALKRAKYVADRAWSASTIVFFGDDDLCSPATAALMPNTDVIVIDIDAGVLGTCSRVAKELGCSLRTLHQDLSTAFHAFDECDVVVADPNPSGDGSFESMFWSAARTKLKKRGKIVTTFSPSHKPESYSLGALNALQEQGFCLVDLQDSLGRYSVFEFEYTPMERNMLRELGVSSLVSHTKSLCTASRVEDGRQYPTLNLDFGAWVDAARDHYLTVQAGQTGQESIASSRSPSLQRYAAVQTSAQSDRGMRIDLLLPERLRTDLSGISATNICEVFRSELNVSPTEQEMADLTQLQDSTELRLGETSSVLGLAARALESWERPRFEKQSVRKE